MDVQSLLVSSMHSTGLSSPFAPSISSHMLPAGLNLTAPTVGCSGDIINSAAQNAGGSTAGTPSTLPPRLGSSEASTSSSNAAFRRSSTDDLPSLAVSISSEQLDEKARRPSNTPVLSPLPTSASRDSLVDLLLGPDEALFARKNDGKPSSVIDEVLHEAPMVDLKLQQRTRLLSPNVVAEATEVLKMNDRGGYTIPAKGLYPYQWNWDSAFVAMGWSTVDESRAWLELEKLLSGQWEDGMVPHIVFHQASDTYFPGPEIWGSKESPRGSTGITQPPIAATAVRHLVEAKLSTVGDWHESAATWQKVEELFPKLMKYHRWFESARDPDGTGLVATLHPWETGMDNSPAWDGPLADVPVDAIPPYVRRDLGHVDAAMRPTKAEYDRYLTLVYRFRSVDYDPSQLYHISPFRVTDVCTNSLLHRANLDLRWLAVSLNKEDEIAEIDAWLDKSSAAFDSLWDESSGIYRSWNQLTNKPLDAATSGGFLPLFARVASPDQAAALAQTLERWLDNVQYGVPSLDPADPRFEPLRYWRGPVWAIVNFMINDGLRYYGYDKLADRIEADTRELITENGLFEYFSPVNGSGAGGGYFSWTAAMALSWLDQAEVIGV